MPSTGTTEQKNDKTCILGLFLQTHNRIKYFFYLIGLSNEIHHIGKNFHHCSFYFIPLFNLCFNKDYWCMKMQHNSSDIDLIELFLFLKTKIASIILFVIFSLILSFTFLFITKDKVIIKYQLNMINNSPSMIINCGDDFYCKANAIQSIINNKSKRITSNIDEKAQKINLSWSGDVRDKPVLIAEVNTIHRAIDDWYIQDYQNYKSIVNNQSNNYINGSEIYAKIALLTNSNTAGENKFISISNETVSKSYKPALFMTLSLILSILFSSAYHITKRSVLEYKNKFNRSFDNL